MKSTLASRKEFTPPSRTDRIIILGFALILIAGSLYLALRSNTIEEHELTTIRVTLIADPEFEEDRDKRFRTHTSILLKTKQHARDFKITGMIYKSTDTEAVQADIKAGDELELKLMTADINEMDDDTHFNNYNLVYGLTKGNRSYINLTDLEERANSDSTWAFGFTALGLVFLPYGLMKRKPVISIQSVVYSLVFIAVIIMLVKDCG